MKTTKLTEDESGQAIFEFAIFAPIFLLLLSVLISVAGSINASINQQKAARNYFYHLLKNNSYVLTQEELQFLAGRPAITNASYSAVGWADRMLNEEPVAPCFELVHIGKRQSAQEKCLDKWSSGGTEGTSFIRIFTMYGICGGNFVMNGEDITYLSRPSVGCQLSTN